MNKLSTAVSVVIRGVSTLATVELAPRTMIHGFDILGQRDNGQPIFHHGLTYHGGVSRSLGLDYALVTRELSVFAPLAKEEVEAIAASTNFYMRQQGGHHAIDFSNLQCQDTDLPKTLLSAFRTLRVYGLMLGTQQTAHPFAGTRDFWVANYGAGVGWEIGGDPNWRKFADRHPNHLEVRAEIDRLGRKLIPGRI